MRYSLTVAVPLIAAWVLDRMLRGIFGVAAPYAYLASAALCITALRVVLRVLNPPKLPASLRDAPPEPAMLSTADDGIDEAVAGWTGRLEWSRDDSKRFDQMVKPGLVDIVDERLRLVHGVSRHGDPGRAQAVVPQRLWSFIHEPTTRNMSPQEIAALVAQMEAL